MTATLQDSRTSERINYAIREDAASANTSLDLTQTIIQRIQDMHLPDRQKRMNALNVIPGVKVTESDSTESNVETEPQPASL